MSASVTTDIPSFIEEMLGVAQIGLTYSTDAFDIARFHRLRASAAALLGRIEGAEVEKLGRRIAYDEHYAALNGTALPLQSCPAIALSGWQVSAFSSSSYSARAARALP